jgi:hypothetical protein
MHRTGNDGLREGILSMRIMVPLLLTFTMLSTGCAITEESNRRLTSKLDQLVAPESTPAKVALAPVFIPVGFTSILLDAVIIHPVAVIPDAHDDTSKIIWKGPPSSYVTQAFLFVPKLVATPVVFTFFWLGRSMFDW